MARLRCDPEATDRRGREFAALVGRELLPRLEKQFGSLQEDAILRERVAPGRTRGRNVRLLEFPEPGRRFVVRGLVRPWIPWRRGGRFARYRGAIATADLAARHGLAVPRVFATVEGIRPLTWRQFVLAAEEFVPGHELVRTDDTDAARLFALLGRLHHVRAATWGRVSGGRGGEGTAANFARRRLMPLVRWLLGRMIGGRRRVTIGEEFSAFIERGVREMLAPGGESPFSLLHGDVTPANVLVNAAGEPLLIDLLRSHFGIAAMEFLDALLVFCHDAPARARGLGTAYRTTAPPCAAEQLRRAAPLLAFLTWLDAVASPHERIPGWKPAHAAAAETLEPAEVAPGLRLDIGPAQRDLLSVVSALTSTAEDSHP